MRLSDKRLVDINELKLAADKYGTAGIAKEIYVADVGDLLRERGELLGEVALLEAKCQQTELERHTAKEWLRNEQATTKEMAGWLEAVRGEVRTLQDEIDALRAENAELRRELIEGEVEA